MKEPFASDWVVICTVPFALRTCTVAPAITAPDVSTTVPDSSAVILAPETDFPCASVTCPLTLPSAARDGQGAKKAAKMAPAARDCNRFGKIGSFDWCYLLNVDATIDAYEFSIGATKYFAKIRKSIRFFNS